MADKDNDSSPRSSCVGKLAGLFLLLIVGGLGAALFQISQPQDLSDIAGYGPRAEGQSPRNLKGVLANSLKGNYELTLTEHDLNLYLRDTLKVKQGGYLASEVSLDDVVVRLENDYAEIILVRTIAGHPFTLSMFLRVEQSELPNGSILKEVVRNRGPYHESIPRPGVGGRFGKLPVPEGFLLLVMPAFEKLAAVYRDTSSKDPVKELDYVEEMARFSIVDGKLVLDPRPNTQEMMGPGGF
ncbi:hypothetical protein ACFQY0_08085 [Haloferula chungangensis]|uniref:DUF4230 domain-containing protein n=1 Tax=Haloferula chungangensis TaxID=1048331 RepID=A0ABW2L625_9BACT